MSSSSSELVPVEDFVSENVDSVAVTSSPSLSTGENPSAAVISEDGNTSSSVVGAVSSDPVPSWEDDDHWFESDSSDEDEGCVEVVLSRYYQSQEYRLARASGFPNQAVSSPACEESDVEDHCSSPLDWSKVLVDRKTAFGG